MLVKQPDFASVGAQNASNTCQNMQMTQFQAGYGLAHHQPVNGLKEANCFMRDSLPKEEQQVLMNTQTNTPCIQPNANVAHNMIQTPNEAGNCGIPIEEAINFEPESLQMHNEVVQPDPVPYTF